MATAKAKSGTKRAGRGRARPRPRLSAAERRERILAAATTLFADRGYADASIDAIARQSGITPPVLYDHFASKLVLYEAVLEAHFAELRSIWQGRIEGAPLTDESVGASFDAWFAYVEGTPEAARILFREPGAADAAAVHRAVSERSRGLVMELVAGAPGAAPLAGDDPGREMTWVVFRGVLQGLALWWVDHPDVPRERVVAAAIDSLWTGYRGLLGR